MMLTLTLSDRYIESRQCLMWDEPETLCLKPFNLPVETNLILIKQLGTEKARRTISVATSSSDTALMV